jgi:hypothetical protein
MTIPVEPTPPATIGTNPKNADEVNGLIGTHLRGFLSVLHQIEQDHDFCDAQDLKVAPYYFAQSQEDTLKSAVNGLNTALQAIDLTDINRVVGM